MNWTECDVVEIVPGTLSGAPVIVHSRVRPRALRRLLVGHYVRTAADHGWEELVDGDLLEAAEAAGFDLLPTCDMTLCHQQKPTPYAYVSLRGLA